MAAVPGMPGMAMPVGMMMRSVMMRRVMMVGVAMVPKRRCARFGDCRTHDEKQNTDRKRRLFETDT